MILSRELVVRILRNGFGSSGKVQDTGELLRHLDIGIRVEMPVGSEGGLDFLMP